MTETDDTPGAGHNGVAVDELRSFVERIERLTEEKKAIAEDIRDVFAEAKGRGFDTAAMREVIRLRAIEASKRRERAAMLELYGSALDIDIFA